VCVHGHAYLLLRVFASTLCVYVCVCVSMVLVSACERDCERVCVWCYT